MTPPLIVTARLDNATFAIFDDLRRRHFPSHLNKIPAHLSLFHQLPGDELRAVLATAQTRSAGSAPLELQGVGVRFLGRGVALDYRSPDLTRLRDGLAADWRSWLTPQDRQPFRSHITVQNKVDPATARALSDELRTQALPPCRIDGLMVWRYLGGPWEHLATLRFSPGERA